MTKGWTSRWTDISGSRVIFVKNMILHNYFMALDDTDIETVVDGIMVDLDIQDEQESVIDCLVNLVLVAWSS